MFSSSTCIILIPVQVIFSTDWGYSYVPKCWSDYQQSNQTFMKNEFTPSGYTPCHVIGVGSVENRQSETSIQETMNSNLGEKAPVISIKGIKG